MHIVAASADMLKKSELALKYLNDFCAHDESITPFNVHKGFADPSAPAALTDEAYRLGLLVGEGDNFANTKIKKAYCSDTGDVEKNPPL